MTATPFAAATLSVLIPAHNEADYIDACLAALGQSISVQGTVEVLVLANGCDDSTVQQAQAWQPPQGWRCDVLELAQGHKLRALDAGEARARGRVLVYLDADVIVSPRLLADLQQQLDHARPAYASGTPQAEVAETGFTRAYGRIWWQLPFATGQAGEVPGFGVFAMNRAGRGRWERWPDVISDDTFARLHFANEERFQVASTYRWPLAEGLLRLIRVRRRQNRGVAELQALFPALNVNDTDTRPGAKALLRLAATAPWGLLCYLLVAVAVKLPAPRAERWARGR